MDVKDFATIHFINGPLIGRSTDIAFKECARRATFAAMAPSALSFVRCSKQLAPEHSMHANADSASVHPACVQDKAHANAANAAENAPRVQQVEMPIDWPSAAGVVALRPGDVTEDELSAFYSVYSEDGPTALVLPVAAPRAARAPGKREPKRFGSAPIARTVVQERKPQWLITWFPGVRLTLHNQCTRCRGEGVVVISETLVTGATGSVRVGSSFQSHASCPDCKARPGCGTQQVGRPFVRMAPLLPP